jgi:hypothetical protein
MTKQNFTILFYFRGGGVNAEIDIFEIERTDIPKMRPPAERFQWFRHNKANQTLFPLEFVAMGKTDEHADWRRFKEGTLEFNGTQARFVNYPNQSVDPFEQIAPTELLPAHTAELVSQYFLK